MVRFLYNQDTPPIRPQKFRNRAASLGNVGETIYSPAFHYYNLHLDRS